MQQVGDDEPPRRHLHAVLRQRCRDDEHRVPGANQHQTDRELRRARRLAPSEPDPDPRERRRERDDEQRLQRLEVAAREFPAEGRRPRCAIAEQVQRRSGLLELRPEDRRRDEEDADGIQPFALRRRPVGAEEQPSEEDDDDDKERVARGVGDLLRGDGQCAGVHAQGHRDERDERDGAAKLRARSQADGVGRRRRRRGPQAGIAEVLRAEHVLHEAEDHADARRGEADVPVHPLAEIPADERRDEGAEVDSHVVDREAGVAPRVLCAVKRPDDHRGIAFDEAGADDDQRQAEIERRQRRERHAEVSEGDDDPAVKYGAALADQPIGDPASRQRRHVDHRRVQAVHRAGDGGLEAEPAGRDRRRHEEDQQRAHAVVAEALPHLGEEERREPARMTEEGGIVGARVDRGNSHDGSKNTMIVWRWAARS